MANNIFVSYDLNKPGQDYELLITTIQSLGKWAHVQKSLWYLNTSLGVNAIYEKVVSVMDTSDSLIVLDATNNQAAWSGLSKEVSDFLKANWH